MVAAARRLEIRILSTWGCWMQQRKRELKGTGVYGSLQISNRQGVTSREALGSYYSSISITER